MISVIIPLYNKEKQIRNTLTSVLAQTFRDFELIIVNDGSTDNSMEVVKQFDDRRIRIVEQSNQGVSAARNRGIEEARFDYIALLDADDEWKPIYLQTQVDMINDFPGCSVYACAYEFKNKGVISPIVLKKMQFEERGILANYFEVAAYSHPPLWTSAVVIKKEACLAVGGFPLGVKSGEDLLTWARLAKRYKVAYNTNVRATFVLDCRYNIKATPSRLPAEDDIVGQELRFLLLQNRELVGLREYVSLWHKMRASVYLRSGEFSLAVKEIVKSLRYNFNNIRVWLYLLSAFLPVSLRHYFFNKFAK